MKSSTAVAALLLVSTLLGAARASAQATDPTLAAEDLFQRATSLMTKRQYTEACPLLAESYRIQHTGGTLQNLAVCYEELGKWASSYARFQDLRTLSASGRTPRPDRVALADEHIARLTPLLSRVVVVVPCASLFACQLLVGVKDEDGVPRPVTSDAAATEDADGGSSADPCMKRHPPPRPSAADLLDATTTGQGFVFAVKEFQINPPGTVLGYDLDERCTGDPDSSTSEAPCTSRAGADTTDKPNGVDNEFQRSVVPSFLAPKDGGPADPAAETLNSDIAEGRRTVFIGVTDYNGLENDDEVKVGFAASERMAQAGCGNCTLVEAGPGAFDDAGAPPRPRWDGLDAWYYTPSSVVVQGLPAAPLRGYVSKGVLVVIADRISLSILGADLDFRDAVLTATIAKGSGNLPYILQNGIVAGRIPAAEVVVSASTLKNTLSDCNNVALAFLKEEVCRDRDLPSLKADDGKGSTCESLSIAIGFNAYPVRLGYPGPAAPPLPCDASSFACE